MTEAAFESSILGIYYREYILYFVENSAFGKILKLFIKSDYTERNCVWLVF